MSSIHHHVEFNLFDLDAIREVHAQVLELLSAETHVCRLADEREETPAAPGAPCMLQ
jgi:hypothetical protein